MNDPIYKRIFAFPRIVEDLLRGFVGGDWLQRADFSTLERLPAEYVGDDFRKRLGDRVWRLRLGRSWLHVLVLLEFQSRSETDMALRILEYTVLLYRELSRADGLGPDGLRPPVLPIVLYNGEHPWSAATEVRELVASAGPVLAPYQPSQRYLVVDLQRVSKEDLPNANLVAAICSLERSRTAPDLAKVAMELQSWLRNPRDAELRRAFADWLWWLDQRLRARPDGKTALPPDLDLEDVRMTLEERVAEWPKPWLEKGRQQGFRQGLEHSRALLCRQAALRFGADAAERAAERLERITAPDRLEKVGELIVRCETGREFLARLDA